MPQQQSAPGLLDDAVADLGAAAQGLGLIDGICLGLIAVFALRGFFRGFVRQVALFGAIFGGIALANLFAEPLSGEIPDLTSALESGDRLFAAYLAIFLVTLLVAALCARFLESTLELLHLRSVDRLLGFALGAACGSLLVAFLLACGLVFTPRIGPGEQIHRSLEDSRSLRLVANGVVHLRLALPHPFLVHAEEILENHAEERAAAVSAAPASAPPAVESGADRSTDELRASETNDASRDIHDEPARPKLEAPLAPPAEAPRSKSESPKRAKPNRAETKRQESPKRPASPMSPTQPKRETRTSG